MILKISGPKVPATGTLLLTNAASVSPTWRIPNKQTPGWFEPQYPPDPTLALDCPLFELTPEGAAHWMAMDGWTPDEAALLLAGSNPLRISGFDADPNIYKPDFTSCGYLGLKMRLQRAHEAGVLAFPCHPLKVIEWANSKHAIPAPLEPWLIAPTATPDPVPATQAAPLVNYEPVKVESVEQRRARYLALLEAEERHGKYGALKRIAEREGVDRSNMSKDIDKARGARTTQSRAGNGWATQLVRDGKHTG